MPVILSATKDLARRTERSFAALRMTARTSQVRSREAFCLNLRRWQRGELGEDLFYREMRSERCWGGGMPSTVASGGGKSSSTIMLESGFCTAFLFLSRFCLCFKYFC